MKQEKIHFVLEPRFVKGRDREARGEHFRPQPAETHGGADDLFKTLPRLFGLGKKLALSELSYDIRFVALRDEINARNGDAMPAQNTRQFGKSVPFPRP